MERTEIVSLYKNTPADGTSRHRMRLEARTSATQEHRLHRPVRRRLFKTLQVVLEASKLLKKLR